MRLGEEERVEGMKYAPACALHCCGRGLLHNRYSGFTGGISLLQTIAGTGVEADQGERVRGACRGVGRRGIELQPDIDIVEGAVPVDAVLATDPHDFIPGVGVKTKLFDREIASGKDRIDLGAGLAGAQIVLIRGEGSFVLGLALLAERVAAMAGGLPGDGGDQDEDKNGNGRKFDHGRYK